MKTLLKTDAVFSSLSVPYSRSDYGKLKRNITQRGCKEPICVWQGFIVDGHKRYDICRDKALAFSVKNMKFIYQEEAVAWVCRERLKEGQALPFMRKYLMGRLLRAELALSRIRRKAQIHSGKVGEMKKITDTGSAHENWTAVILGKELSMNRSTLEGYARVSRMVDYIRSRDERVFRALLMGDFQMTVKQLSCLKQASDEEISGLYHCLRAEALKRQSKESEHKKSYMRQRRTNATGGAVPDGKEEKKIEIITGIKEMPKFDPDSELNGLSMTIPMWSNAIRRAGEKMNLHIASDMARMQLRRALLQIDNQVQKLLEELRHD